MTREALSERSAAQTSYEVSILRFGYVLTVCFKRLSWVPCWGPAIPPPPILPRLLSRPLIQPTANGPTRTIRPSGETSEGHPGPFRPKGPLNGRNACWRISFIPASSPPDPSSSRILIRFTLTIALWVFWTFLIYFRTSVGTECTKSCFDF